MIWSLESPSGGLMNCGLAKLSREIRNNKHKIILDGTGLDEGFGGYEIHHLQYLLSLRKNKSRKFNLAVKLFSNNWGINENEVLKKINNFNNVIPKTIDGYDMINLNLTTNDFKKNFINNKLNSNENINTGDDIKDSLIEFIQNTKIPRNNRLKDRISMAFGVELRLPFLEHELLELALSEI